MNSCLFWRRPEDFNQWKHYIWHLVKGIRLLDKVTTTVYRGIDRSNFTLELYKSGKRVVWNSITSCSQIESRAKSFFMKVDEFSFSHNSHITLHFLPTQQQQLILLKNRILQKECFFPSRFQMATNLETSLHFHRSKKCCWNQDQNLLSRIQCVLMKHGL